jgi:hypothetical protein
MVNTSQKHEFIIKCLHDGMAECSAGDWSLSIKGPTTRKEIEEEYRKHLQWIGERMTRKMCPKCDFCQSKMKPQGNKWVCDCGRGWKPRMVESAPVDYTPGPWSVDKKSTHMVCGRPPEGWYPTPQNPRYIVTQTSVYVNTPWEEHNANARLIAAAPEMLAALRAVVSTYRTFREVPKKEQEWTPLDDEALEAAFKAIEKAEGKESK